MCVCVCVYLDLCWPHYTSNEWISPKLSGCDKNLFRMRFAGMKILSVRCEILMVVLLKIQVIWGVTLCKWVSSAWPATHCHIPENLCLQVLKCLLFQKYSVHSVRSDALK